LGAVGNFFLINKNEYIRLVVCDLSEPGPVPGPLHIKDINVNVEEKMMLMFFAKKGKLLRICSTFSSSSFREKSLYRA